MYDRSNVADYAILANISAFVGHTLHFNDL